MKSAERWLKSGPLAAVCTCSFMEFPSTQFRCLNQQAEKRNEVKIDSPRCRAAESVTSGAGVTGAAWLRHIQRWQDLCPAASRLTSGQKRRGFQECRQARRTG